MVDNIILASEVQLMDWGESRSSGPWIKLRLQDPDQLDVFRGMDTAELKKTGHLFDLLLADSESWPAAIDVPSDALNRARSGTENKLYAQMAGRLCTVDDFQEYLHVSSEEGAKRKLYEMCDMTSRKELSTDPKKRDRFISIHEGYSDWLKGKYEARTIARKKTANHGDYQDLGPAG
jgi:hypothetical protein